MSVPTVSRRPSQSAVAFFRELLEVRPEVSLQDALFLLTDFDNRTQFRQLAVDAGVPVPTQLPYDIQ